MLHTPPSMFVDTILAKIFGTKNERDIKKILPRYLPLFHTFLLLIFKRF